MGKLLVASFAVIANQIPGRSLLGQVSWLEILALFVLTTAGSLLQMVFPVSNIGENDAMPIGFSALLLAGSSVAVVLLTWILINSYAKEKFSFKEVVVLQILLTAGSGLSLCLAGLLAYLAPADLSLMYDFGSLVFTVYMLYISMVTVRKVAALQNRAAIVVVLAPIFIVLALWVFFLAGTFGAASISSGN